MRFPQKLRCLRFLTEIAIFEVSNGNCNVWGFHGNCYVEVFTEIVMFEVFTDIAMFEVFTKIAMFELFHENCVVWGFHGNCCVWSFHENCNVWAFSQSHVATQYAYTYTPSVQYTAKTNGSVLVHTNYIQTTDYTPMWVRHPPTWIKRGE